YGRPPSQLRSRTPRPAAAADAHRAGSQAAHREAAADGSWLTLRLACRAPFDGRSLLRFLAARAIPGVEEVSDGRYARTVRVPGGGGGGGGPGVAGGGGAGGPPGGPRPPPPAPGGGGGRPATEAW